KATNEAIKGSKVFLSLDYQIDPAGTDLVRDMYKVNKKSVVENVSWAKGRIELDTSMSLRFERKPATQADEYRVHGRKLNTILGGSMSVKGDTLEMLKLMSVDKARECSGELTPSNGEESKPTGLEAISARHHCNLYEAITGANSLAEVETAMRRALDDQRSSLQAFLKATTPSVERISDKVLQEEALKLLAAAEGQLATLNSVTIESLDDGFRMKAPSASMMRNCKLKNFEMVVRKDYSLLAGELEFKLPERFYDALKPEIAHMLHGIEEGREFGMEHIAYHVRVSEKLLAARGLLSEGETSLMQLPIQVLQAAE
ncbi:MAG: hypothetical protein RIQ81_471, partial [Pseudomonadota bacterium]